MWADKRKNTGFTIIELLIATSVFTIILLAAVIGFFTVGQTFYKGVSNSQTQTVARKILDSASSDIRFASTVTSAIPIDSGNSYYICIGEVRYTYNFYKKVELDNHDTSNNFGIIRDEPGACGSPFGSGAIEYNNPTELLANKMRLGGFFVWPKGDNLYQVVVKVAYGDNESLEEFDNYAVSCDTNLTSSRFCAVSELSTMATKGY